MGTGTTLAAVLAAMIAGLHRHVSRTAKVGIRGTLALVLPLPFNRASVIERSQ